MKKYISAFGVLLAITGLTLSLATAQTRKTNRRPDAPPPPSAETNAAEKTKAEKTAPEPARTPAKKNERPSNNAGANASKAKITPVYFYDFTQPAFTVPKIHIEHDETGKGTITFAKSTSSEDITDPLEVSPAALERINAALAALDFFNSRESYQYEKDYSHLGNITLRFKKGERERETRFNWTQNPEAKKLADEYRKLANQYIWIFDMNLARENQPLNAPQLMDLIDGYYRRHEISDAAQLLPFLKELSDDERIPLIARNHAARMIKDIEKQQNKK